MVKVVIQKIVLEDIVLGLILLENFVKLVVLQQKIHHVTLLAVVAVD